MIEEISVDEKYRKNGVAKALLLKIVSEAKKKYDITKVNGATYYGDDDMPFAWYERIGFEKVEDLFLIEADAEQLISKLKD